MQRHDTPPVDVYADDGPAAWSVCIMLAECHLPYRRHALSGADAQPLPPSLPRAAPGTLTVAVVDHDTGVHVFGPGAALQYLAEKCGRLLPVDLDERFAALSWLDWVNRNLFEVACGLRDPRGALLDASVMQPRLQRVLDELNGALASRPFLAGEYSIADLAAWSLLEGVPGGRDMLIHHQALHRWNDAVRHRPATRHGPVADLHG